MQVAVIAASCCVGPGRWWWWWWLQLNVVAASLTDLRWYWSWPLHLAHIVLSFYQPAQVVVTGCNLWWCFFLQPLAQTLPAPVVVPPFTTCAEGLFPSTHWRRYSTCARATCTVWWWSVVVVVVCGGGGGDCSYRVVAVNIYTVQVAIYHIYIYYFKWTMCNSTLDPQLLSMQHHNKKLYIYHHASSSSLFLQQEILHL